MTLDVEGVVDGGVCGKKLLGRTRTLEPLDLAFPPSCRLMRILSSVVLPSPALMPAFDPKLSNRDAVRSQVVCDRSLTALAVEPVEQVALEPRPSIEKHPEGAELGEVVRASNA